MRFILEILITGLAFFFGAKLVPGVSVDGYTSALIASILVGLANATIGFILRLFTFPINFLTLGLVSFIITVLMILLVDNLMTSFNTSGFLSAALLAIIVAIIKAIFNVIAGDKE
jgi:putative membrane protein